MRPAFKAASVLLTWQGLVLYRERLERRALYISAESFARARNKPLLIAGGPAGGILAKLTGQVHHGFGDVCLDLDESACIGGKAVALVGDIREIPYPDKYFGAALASHILEHIPTVSECLKAVAELHRVSDSIYIAGPSKQDIVAWLYGDHHLWVTQQNDGTILLEQR